MVKKLEDLLIDVGGYKLYGKRRVSVSGITDDSRKVKKGYVFVAIKGLTVDAHKFIPDVISKGAKAVVGEIDPKKEWLKKVTYVKVPDSRRTLSLLASTWHSNPSKKLKIIGITGTDGKTTTASIIAHILNSAGKKTGLITTVSAKIGDKEYDTGFHVTNPEPLLLQKFLAKMVKENCEYAVLEVTSHGLDQERVAGIDFEIGVLTNVTHEHLDYHKSYQDYLLTKASLFEKVKKVAVLNVDDKSYANCNCLTPLQRRVIGYGIDNGEISSSNIKRIENGTEFNVLYVDWKNDKVKKIRIKTKLQGIYNVYNILAAVSVALALNVPKKIIQAAMLTFKAPTGRLDEIKNEKGLKIYIDFAHTPNSLKSVLADLKKRTKGKLIAVFGCAGERDIEKRKLMPQISVRLADISVFTAEDPRSESVKSILKVMSESAERFGAVETSVSQYPNIVNVGEQKYFIRVPERGEAIYSAIRKLANKGDTVVICGKGHEKSMAYDGIEHPWSDKHTVENALGAKKDLCAIILAAGKGTRLKSRDPKVLNNLAGRPMISYTLASLRKALFGNLITVIGYKKQLVMESVGPSVSFAYQNKMLGTGHAAWQGMKMVPKNIKNTVVLNGDDSAFYKPETILKILLTHKKKKAVITFVSLQKSNSFGLGRVTRDNRDNLLGIVEEKDANTKQKKITEVNDGLYVFDRKWFLENIKEVKKSASGEYYLVDLVKVALSQGKNVEVYKLKNKNEWFGVNTKKELQIADREMRKIIKGEYQL